MNANIQTETQTTTRTHSNLLIKSLIIAIAFSHRSAILILIAGLLGRRVVTGTYNIMIFNINMTYYIIYEYQYDIRNM